MSELMLDDKNTMDDMNPFVDFMPGSSRQPHAFGKYTEPVDEPEEECSLSRPLLPGRNIDKGFTNPGHFFDIEKAVKVGTNNNFIMNLISLLCLILLIVMF